ncbi:hypothetical protein AFK66_020685 [Cronobacter malonaticus LMG 23826]|nr:hypothetical protein AFK66_020685 [Cronobacter malonaticus LMG 23826]
MRQLARYDATCHRAHRHAERGWRQRLTLRRKPPRGGAQQAERKNTALMRIHAAGGAEHRLFTRKPGRAKPPQHLAFAKPGVLRALLIKHPQPRRNCPDARDKQRVIHILVRTAIGTVHQPRLGRQVQFGVQRRHRE